MAFPEKVTYPNKYNLRPIIEPDGQFSAENANHIKEKINKNALFHGVHDNLAALQAAWQNPTPGHFAYLLDGTHYRCVNVGWTTNEAGGSGNYFFGYHEDLPALRLAHPTAIPGARAILKVLGANDQEALWDEDAQDWFAFEIISALTAQAITDALNYTPADDAEVVKSISANGGTPQTPDGSGNIDLTVSVESAESHATFIDTVWNEGDSQIFPVSDSSKVHYVKVQGGDLREGDEWEKLSATEIRIIIDLDPGNWVWITGSNVSAAGGSYDDTALTLIAKTDVISFFIGGSGKLVLGDSPVDMFAPYDFTLTGFFAGVTDAPTGSSAVFDLKKNGVSVTSTKAMIDVNEFTSLTGTAPILTGDLFFAKGTKITGVISGTDALETATAPILNLEIIKS